MLAEQLILLERRVARINHEVILVIDHAFQVARRHVEREPDAGRHALEEPDMARRHGEFDVTHAFPTNASQRHFHAAAIADDAAMLDAFILAARTLPVLDGTE